MDEPTLHELAQRLNRTERELRRLKWIGGLVLAGVLGLTVMGGARPPEPTRVVEAEKYVLVDSNGTVQAVLGPTRRLLFGLGPGVTFYNSKGEEHVEAVADEGKLQLTLQARDTQRAALYGLEASRAGVLFAHKGERKGGATLLLEDDGSLIMRLGTEENEARVELGLQADGTPKLVLRDRDGNTIWKAP